MNCKCVASIASEAGSQGEYFKRSKHSPQSKPLEVFTRKKKKRQSTH